MSAAAEDGDAGLARSSGVMAVGTALSRVLGFVRNAVLVTALGGAIVNDAYNIANSVPNVLYTLLAGGVLNAVFVPQLVRAMTRGDEEGRRYADRLLTLSMLLIGAVTVVATLAAPLVVALYTGGEWEADDVALATAFAYWCLPQIFFYGLYTMLGQVLNARGSFGPMMWTPILNNVVVIATGGAFIAFVAVDRLDSGALVDRAGAIALLGAGTTLGIVVQALALVPVLRRTGYSFRPRLDLRGSGLGRAGSLAKWTVALVVVNQLGYLVVIRLVGDAGKLLASETGTGGGITAYQNAYLMFLLPHAVVTVSVVTALLPRMSRAAAEGNLAGVGADVAHGLRLTAVATVPASLLFLALGPALGVALFSFGESDVETGAFFGLVLSGFALGLVPFSAHHLLLRGFYAQEDTRTPFLLACLVAASNAALAYLAYALLPVQLKTIGIAASYAVAYGVGALAAAAVLRRRVGRLDGARVLRTYVRLAVAGAVAALVAVAVQRVVEALVPWPEWPETVAGLAAALLAAAAAYLALASRMRVRELTSLVGLVRGRLGR